MPFTAESSSCLGEAVHFRCPAILPSAVKRAPEQKMASASAYMRQAIANQLKRNGVDLGRSRNQMAAAFLIAAPRIGRRTIKINQNG